MWWLFYAVSFAALAGATWRDASRLGQRACAIVVGAFLAAAELGFLYTWMSGVVTLDVMAGCAGFMYLTVIVATGGHPALLAGLIDRSMSPDLSLKDRRIVSTAPWVIISVPIFLGVMAGVAGLV